MLPHMYRSDHDFFGTRGLAPRQFDYIASMDTRLETFYTRKICNYLIIRIKMLLCAQLLNACHAERQACRHDRDLI